MMGTVYTNIADDDKLFKQLNYFSPPILLLFFVRSGMSFQLDALVSSSGDLNGVPLLVIEKMRPSGAQASVTKLS